MDVEPNDGMWKNSGYNRYNKKEEVSGDLKPEFFNFGDPKGPNKDIIPLVTTSVYDVYHFDVYYYLTPTSSTPKFSNRVMILVF